MIRMTVEMDLKGIIPNEKKKPISKVMYCMIPLIYHSVDNNIIKMDNSGCQGLAKWREGVL